MKEDDLVITITEVKPVSTPLKPGYIEVLPNRYVGIAQKRCEGGFFESCNKADTTKCQCCGLYLCASHLH